MPTRRTRIAHVRLTLGPFEAEHLETGPDHLLAAGPGMGCAICRSGIEIARPLWQENRAARLAGWRYPFPCFGQIIFDRVSLPDAEPAHIGDRTIAALIRAAVAESR